MIFKNDIYLNGMLEQEMETPTTQFMNDKIKILSKVNYQREDII
jgi:hypothetical protein